ncbi:MAG: hypothetical protein IBJ15_00995 [Alphaproteobacteria bacterium]|nr:hypothetical protein [Alphaproteobacteria bacterium]
MPRLTIDYEGAPLPVELSDALCAIVAGGDGGSSARRLVKASSGATLAEQIARFRGPDGERYVTRTGRIVNRFAPEPGDWDLETLVWSQANLSRYGGEYFAAPEADGLIRSALFYSTAEHELHAIRARRILFPDVDPVRGALLDFYLGTHDLVEVRVSDLITHIKALFPDFSEYEKLLESSFYGTFGLPGEMPAEVKTIDKRLVVNEGPALFPGTDLAFWHERTGGREAIPGLNVPDPAFCVDVDLSVAQTGASSRLGWPQRFWSYPPLVAIALMRELDAALDVLVAHGAARRPGRADAAGEPAGATAP